MKNTNGFEGLDPYSIKLITYKSRRLCRQGDFTSSDYEDVEIDLVLHLRSRLDRYNSERSSYKTYVNTVLENRVREIVYERTRVSSDHRLVEYSLDEKYVDDTGKTVCRGDFLSDDDYRVRTGSPAISDIESAELRVDIQRALDALPEKWQWLCGLMAEYSMVEVSRISGIKRHQLYIIRKRIQSLFRRFGLDQYL